MYLQNLILIIYWNLFNPRKFSFFIHSLEENGFWEALRETKSKSQS